ncbi:hypothetical protein EXU30_02265 [Shewanella maritima]|uniref:Uncharacterized protein n=1 Tax=Shewanella maritima TaxID=2520507 RepID=A0A411PDK8_9GAMM|nr:hypothetical protein [Shewanella maritima]QBF81645.1 hypothetical protein EXU30_02265 [Shewanella maritima]
MSDIDSKVFLNEFFGLPERGPYLLRQCGFDEFIKQFFKSVDEPIPVTNKAINAEVSVEVIDPQCCALQYHHSSSETLIGIRRNRATIYCVLEGKLLPKVIDSALKIYDISSRKQVFSKAFKLPKLAKQAHTNIHSVTGNTVVRLRPQLQPLATTDVALHSTAYHMQCSQLESVASAGFDAQHNVDNRAGVKQYFSLIDQAIREFNEVCRADADESALMLMFGLDDDIKGHIMAFSAEAENAQKTLADAIADYWEDILSDAQLN